MRVNELSRELGKTNKEVLDLLKKQDIDNPKAQEYIEVLDRKSQRLKKLTEDLVEASKASTGSLSVHLDRLGMVQLVQQALGEFEEKFAQSRLTVVPAFPEEECSILPTAATCGGSSTTCSPTATSTPWRAPASMWRCAAGGQGGPVHQEHLPPAPQHPRRAAHARVRR